jgi:2-methylfumaryl-CoA hydratase
MVSSVGQERSSQHISPWGEEGPYFEDFEVGMRIRSLPCRTFTEADNIMWLSFSGDANPMYIDREYAKLAGHPQNPIHPLIVLSLTIALSVKDTSMNTLAFLGAEYMRIHRPVFPGDTLCVESEVVAKRESRSRPEAGVLTWIHRSYNQRGELVAEVRRSNLVYKKQYAPWRRYLEKIGRG